MRLRLAKQYDFLDELIWDPEAPFRHWKRHLGEDDIPVAECYFLDMGRPVKLSDVLVREVRLIGEISGRSIAGQIEYWANLGRAVEHLLLSTQELVLCKSATTRPLLECLESVDSQEGERRVAEYLKAQSYPHFEGDQDSPGLLVRIEADGKRTVGRFVNRRFRRIGPKRR